MTRPEALRAVRAMVLFIDRFELLYEPESTWYKTVSATSVEFCVTD